MPVVKQTWFEAAKLCLPLVIAIFGGWATAKSEMANASSRISVIESRTNRIEEGIVPRKEHEAHWDAIQHSLQDIKSQQDRIEQKVERVADKVAEKVNRQ
jgi:predicted  nucleic acid-binding Zn-ribbon protein